MYFIIPVNTVFWIRGRSTIYLENISVSISHTPVPLWTTRQGRGTSKCAKEISTIGRDLQLGNWNLVHELAHPRWERGRKERELLLTSWMLRNLLLVEKRKSLSHSTPAWKVFDSWGDKDFITLSVGADDYIKTQYTLEWKCFSHEKTTSHSGNQLQEISTAGWKESWLASLKNSVLSFFALIMQWILHWWQKEEPWLMKFIFPITYSDRL